VPDWERDAVLLEQWKGGDTRAGEEILTRHADVVIRFFRNKVNDVEDLVQQTFLRLIEAQGRIQAGTTLRSYILGIADRVLLEHMRKFRPNIEPNVDSVAALTPGPSTIVGRKREHRLLVEAMRRIPLEHQTTLELYYWEGLKANEIAEIAGVSHSAMRSRLAAARKALTKAIAALDADQALVDSTITGIDKWAQEIADSFRAR
jgi:RNA polymerase sigma factor (sigma-70 family)